MKIDPEKLFQTFTNRKFLNMEGLSNEVPIFIQPYDVENEDEEQRSIKGLAARLETQGISILHIDLFSCICDILKREGVFDDIIEQESEFEKSELLETLHNFSDPNAYLIPEIISKIDTQRHKVVFITGSGHLFPFCRTHQILEALQPAMLQLPTVIFFPGKYTQIEGLGSQLELFGKLKANRYYRAYDLNHYVI